MKKLIMCAVAVLGAYALNAASVNWGIGDIWGNDEIVGTITLAAGSVSSVGVIDGSTGTVSGTLDGVTWGEDPFSTGYAWTATANVKGSDGNFYEKVFNLSLGTVDTTDDRANVAMFQGMVDSFKENDLMPDGWLDESDLASAGWTKSGGGTDVPEPTSGLLLLVGGAMLALRRKRA